MGLGQDFIPLHPQLEKTLMLGKIESKRRRGQQRKRWLDSITFAISMNLSKFLELVKDRETDVLQCIGSQRVGHDLVTEIQFCFREGRRTFRKTVLPGSSTL